MAAPTPSDLDYTQCIQGSYDDANGRLRVDAAITAPLDVNGEVLVDVRASDGDSVLVYGTTDATTSGPQQVLKVNNDGSIDVQNVNSVVSSTATLSNVTSSTSSQTVLTPNSSRKGFILYNDSASNCFIAFASSASSSLFTIELNAGMTYQNEAIIYIGVISVIWQSPSGFLRVTELT